MSGMSHGWFRAQWIFSLGVALLLTSCGVASARDAIPESQPGVIVVVRRAAGSYGRAMLRGRARRAVAGGVEGVGITEHLNASCRWTRNSRPTTVARSAGRLLRWKAAGYLVLNYYRCPMLCAWCSTACWNHSRNWSDRREQFEIVTVSFNPFEGPELANLKRQLPGGLRPAAAANGWHFPVGRKDAIRGLLDTTGLASNATKPAASTFTAAIMLCTPDGRISRYLYGIVFEPRTLRLSLVEASEGKIGTTMDQLLLFCYHFEGGEYTLAAMNVARAGALLTLLILGSVLVWLWRREVDRRRAAPPRQEPGA